MRDRALDRTLLQRGLRHRARATRQCAATVPRARTMDPRKPAKTRALRQIELPRHAEAVADPREAPAEAVVAERHEGLAALGERGDEALLLGLGRAIDEQ